MVDNEATAQFGVTAESIRATPNYVRQQARGHCFDIKRSGQPASTYIESEIEAATAALEEPRPSSAPFITIDDIERLGKVMRAAAENVCPDL